MRKEYVEKGTRFYHWTVIDDLGYINGTRKFLCRCDCGNEKEVIYTHLKRGKTKSCGLCNYKKVRVGDKFGHWTVLSVQEKVPRGSMRMTECQCSCGLIKKVSAYKLADGLSTGCGHWKSNAKDYRRLYGVYTDMISRCSNENNQKFKDYGARGISICDEWKGNNGFDRFREWAYKNGYDENADIGECTLDRINVNGNYEPSNCRWATNLQQANNKRNTIYITYLGETHTITEWSNITGINRRVIENRYYRGYQGDDLFFSGTFDNKGRRKL